MAYDSEISIAVSGNDSLERLLDFMANDGAVVV